MDDGDVEHARAYLGYGEPLQGRIKDCRYAEAIANTWRRVQSRVCVQDRSDLFAHAIFMALTKATVA